MRQPAPRVAASAVALLLAPALAGAGVLEGMDMRSFSGGGVGTKATNGGDERPWARSPHDPGISEKGKLDLSASIYYFPMDRFAAEPVEPRRTAMVEYSASYAASSRLALFASLPFVVSATPQDELRESGLANVNLGLRWWALGHSTARFRPLQLGTELRVIAPTGFGSSEGRIGTGGRQWVGRADLLAAWYPLRRAELSLHLRTGRVQNLEGDAGSGIETVLGAIANLRAGGAVQRWVLWSDLAAGWMDDPQLERLRGGRLVDEVDRMIEARCGIGALLSIDGKTPFFAGIELGLPVDIGGLHSSATGSLFLSLQL